MSKIKIAIRCGIRIIIGGDFNPPLKPLIRIYSIFNVFLTLSTVVTNVYTAWTVSRYKPRFKLSLMIPLNEHFMFFFYLICIVRIHFSHATRSFNILYVYTVNDVKRNRAGTPITYWRLSVTSPFQLLVCKKTRWIKLNPFECRYFSVCFVYPFSAKTIICLSIRIFSTKRLCVLYWTCLYGIDYFHTYILEFFRK
jgi:hypothetical protein